MAKKTAKKVVKKITKVVKPLTKTEKERVDVLKDAIAQLKLGVYSAASGGYVFLKESEPEWDAIVESQDKLASVGIKIDVKNTQVQKLLPNLISKSKPCEVCAKGALAISAIKKFNNVSVEELSCESGLDGIASNKAQDFFGKENADRMERFYENWSSYEDAYRFNETDKIEEWNDKYGYQTDESLIAIYSNAIANKGIFKP